MKEEEKVKFTCKSEIAHAISVLTPFAMGDNPQDFAIKKIKELTKLL